MRAVAEQWLATRVLRPKTEAAYESVLRLRIYPTFETTPVAHVTAMDLQQWVADLTRSGLAPGTVHNAFTLLRGVLDSAVRAGYLRANPARVLEMRDLLKVHQREMHFLTAQQVRDLAGALPCPYDLMVRFAAVTGARAGEVNGLRWEHADLLRGRVKIAESISRVGTTHHINPPKKGSPRTVPLTKALADDLRAYAATHPDFAPESYVWPDPGDSRAALAYSRDFYLPLWRPAVKAAGLPADVRFHDLRHTCAALLIAANVPAKAIQVHLGHKSFTITMDVFLHHHDGCVRPPLRRGGGDGGQRTRRAVRLIGS